MHIQFLYEISVLLFLQVFPFYLSVWRAGFLFQNKIAFCKRHKFLDYEIVDQIAV